MAEDKDKADHKRKRVNEKKRETSKLLNSIIESNGLKMQGKILSFNSRRLSELILLLIAHPLIQEPLLKRRQYLTESMKDFVITWNIKPTPRNLTKS